MMRDPDRGIVLPFPPVLPQDPVFLARPAQLHDLATARQMRVVQQVVFGGWNALEIHTQQAMGLWCAGLWELSLKQADFWLKVAMPYGNRYQQAKIGQALNTLNSLMYDA